MTTQTDLLFDHIIEWLRDHDLTADQADKIVEDAAEMAKDAFREEYEDDACPTCGGSGGGDPPMRCSRCCGSGIQRREREDHR